MTSPATHAEGLRVLWLLASRGVSATWDGTAVAIIPPDRAADGAIEALEAVLRPDDAGRSHLQRSRERHAPFLREVKAAKPADATAPQWRRAIEGLESFLLSGWADEALRLGWPKTELFRIPPVWARVELCGAGLLIGDHELIAVTSSEIRVRTASGSTLAFYRKPRVDYALAYRERLKLFGEDSTREEAQLRSLEAVVNVCRANAGVDLEQAKRTVLAAIRGPAA